MSNKLEEFKSQGHLIHDARCVRGFFEDYRFLSNFADADIWFEGEFYLSSEAAYQAAKVLSPYRERIAKMSAKESKRGWQTFPRNDKNSEDWNARKFQVMRAIVFEKFQRNAGLRSALMLTGQKYLEETNWWGDTYWGVCPKLGGKNNLGKILMATREFLRISES